LFVFSYGDNGFTEISSGQSDQHDKVLDSQDIGEFIQNFSFAESDLSSTDQTITQSFVGFKILIGTCLFLAMETTDFETNMPLHSTYLLETHSPCIP
jgi:hypothetical protein